MESFALILSGVFRESSRLVIFLVLFRRTLNSASAQKERVLREPVVVMKLQQVTENGMFGRPAGNTFALVSSICGLLNDEAYCCEITRNGSLLQVLKDMRVTVKISCFSHG